MRIKPDYHENETITLQAITKIYAECFGISYAVTNRFNIFSACYEDAVQCTSAFTGLECIPALAKHIDRAIAIANDDIYDSRLRNNLFKIYEHRKIVCDTLLLLRERLCINDKDFDNAYNSYYEHIKTIQECYLLMTKVILTKERAGMSRIISKLDTMYQHDFRVLRDICSILRTCFVRYL
jgi:hypothetical protein